MPASWREAGDWDPVGGRVQICWMGKSAARERRYGSCWRNTLWEPVHIAQPREVGRHLGTTTRCTQAQRRFQSLQVPTSTPALAWPSSHTPTGIIHTPPGWLSWCLAPPGPVAASLRGGFPVSKMQGPWGSLLPLEVACAICAGSGLWGWCCLSHQLPAIVGLGHGTHMCLLRWMQPVPMVTRRGLQTWDLARLPCAPCDLLTHVRAGESPDSSLPSVFPQLWAWPCLRPLWSTRALGPQEVAGVFL